MTNKAGFCKIEFFNDTFFLLKTAYFDKTILTNFFV